MFLKFLRSMRIFLWYNDIFMVWLLEPGFYLINPVPMLYAFSLYNRKLTGDLH